MFESIEALAGRYKEVTDELASGTASADPNKFKNLMKEQSDLQPIVEKYQAYKANNEQIEFFENYRDAREGKTEFIIKNPEIRRVMQILEAVWESSEKNEVIKFDGGL